MSEAFGPSTFERALSLDLSSRQRDRHPWRRPRLHYSSDLSPDSCRRRTFYALRYDPEPLPLECQWTSRLGDLAEEIALDALAKDGRIVGRQVAVKPLRLSAWCWDGTCDAVVRENDGDLYVYELKSVEPPVAELLAKTGRLDLARRERHLWQLGAYRHALAERVGQGLKHKLVFVPRGDGPIVEMSPALPSVEEIAAQEIERASLIPGYGPEVEPLRLELVQRPKKKTFEAPIACRWCGYRTRCGIDGEVERANAGGEAPAEEGGAW